MTSKLNQFIQSLKNDLGLHLSIGLGIFLFALFFQPFGYHNLNYESMLLFYAGLGGISFLLILVLRIIVPRIIHQYGRKDHLEMLHPNAWGFILFLLSAVAFAFYIQYVGKINISFYMMLKVVIICLAPPVILRIHDQLNANRRDIKELETETKALKKKLEIFHEDDFYKNIILFSESGSEKLEFAVTDLAYIKSADNYAEIFFQEGENFSRKLLRNTLKQIEVQLEPYENFIRCHRSCIVNSLFIEKLEYRFGNYRLKLKGYEELLPVSRPYLMNIKEVSQSRDR